MWAPSTDNAVRSRWLRVLSQMDLRPCNGCDLCKIRCAEGVQMTWHEYEAVRRREERVDASHLCAVLDQDKRLDQGDGVEVRMCRYLDMESGACSIYEARPLVCRLLGHVEWMPCPVDKIDHVADTVDAVALMRAYAADERQTFEQWDERYNSQNQPRESAPCETASFVPLP